MASLDEILNWAIPLVLLLIAAGFLWVKLIRPYVAPMLASVWGRVKETDVSVNIIKKKEIVYE